jgi:pimeloyl-ACP methyl ester carboxylesterase
MSLERPAWLMLRGLARESGHWGGFVERFTAAFPKDEILWLDLPGAGDCRDVPSPTNMTGIFQFVRGQAIEKSNARTFRLLALSLGGMVALEWLRQKPEEIESCILINTSSAKVSPFYNRLRWQVWTSFLRLLTEQSIRERERGILDLLLNKDEVREQALPLWTRLATERPMSYLNFARQLQAAATVRDLPQAPQENVLLLSSLGDRFVDPSCSTDLQKYLSCSIERHPWAGHDLPWDDPEWIIERAKSLVDAKQN